MQPSALLFLLFHVIAQSIPSIAQIRILRRHLQTLLLQIMVQFLIVLHLLFQLFSISTSMSMIFILYFFKYLQQYKKTHLPLFHHLNPIRSLSLQIRVILTQPLNAIRQLLDPLLSQIQLTLQLRNLSPVLNLVVLALSNNLRNISVPNVYLSNLHLVLLNLRQQSLNIRHLLLILVIQLSVCLLQSLTVTLKLS